MNRRRLRLSGLALCLALAGVLPGCATSHLLEWSNERPSTFGQPQEQKSIYVRAGGTVIAFPVTVVWDTATFPFQWIWGVYPYGEETAPSEFEGK